MSHQNNYDPYQLNIQFILPFDFAVELQDKAAKLSLPKYEDESFDLTPLSKMQLWSHGIDKYTIRGEQILGVSLSAKFRRVLTLTDNILSITYISL